MNQSDGDEDGVVVALTTLPDPASASRIGTILVEERVAACVSRIPGVVSIYRFEGAVHEDAETVLLIKTTRGRVRDLEQRLGQLHPYKVPEFVVLDAAAVSGAYASWLRSVVQ
jgi:periplasmic divalent cation tolerance protein